jgi:predicted kinase
MKERQDAVMQQLNEIMNVQEENQESINRQLNKRKHDQMEVRQECFCPF